jgi:hypothetical protein
MQQMCRGQRHGWTRTAGIRRLPVAREGITAYSGMGFFFPKEAGKAGRTRYD